MDLFLPILMLLFGLALGVAACWFGMAGKLQLATVRARGELTGLNSQLCIDVERLNSEVDSLRRQAEALQDKNHQLGADKASLETQIREGAKLTNEKLKVLTQAEEKFTDTFKALSSEALKSNNATFLQVARTALAKDQEVAKGDLDKRQLAIDTLVKPIEKSLKRVDEKLEDLEKKRLQAYTGLEEQVKQLKETHSDLRDQTANLVTSLRAPTVRGRWGEIQLKRVVEMAGMIGHCDFYEQQTVGSEDGKLRPDMVIKLPGHKTVVVDAKAPLTSYLDSVESKDEDERLALLKNHAAQVAKHVNALSKKSYSDQFEHSPEFVVLFLPGEVFFSAALEHDPKLIEMGVEQNVIIATPTTLIALLRAVAYGWRQEQLAENAKEISKLGKQLYERLSVMGNHLAKVGKSLNGATSAYNDAIGSLDCRVFVTARKFEELGVVEQGLPALPPIEQTTRRIDTAELCQAEPSSLRPSDV